MKKLEIRNMKNGGSHYTKDGVPITNFTLSVKKILVKSKGAVEYEFSAYVDTEIYMVTVSSARLKQKFLRDLPVYIEDEEVFYKNLCSSVLGKYFTEDEVLCQTGRNGLQKVNEKWLYVCSNGYIDKGGFHTGICSGIEGMYIPETAVVDTGEEKKVINSLFQIYNQNNKVFYPLFLINIMAITNAYFREIRESNFMKLTLWIDGASGSGKTELAKSVGNYLFRNSGLEREVISATGNRRKALKRLAQHSGSVCILDDIKKEPTRERRNSVKNIVDDFIRSVFQGQITDAGIIGSEFEAIDCCSVITGEYLDTMESQNARMLYMKVDGFLKNRKNSRVLYALQKNPVWLTSVCAGYIRWLLENMEENNFPKLLEEKLERLRKDGKKYAGVSNAERLNENRIMLEMAAEMVKAYFQKAGMGEGFIGCFLRNAQGSIQEISDSTFYLLGGERMVTLKVLKTIFSGAKIRRAYYAEDKFTNFYSERYKYIQEYFWINVEEDFVWIDDYKKSMLIGTNDRNEQYDENPCLMIREERLKDLFQEEIQKLLQEGKISSPIADKVSANMLKILREMQIIYKQYRADSKWGRATARYPVYECRNICREYDENCMVVFEPVIQMNTWHPCIETLKERMDEADADGEIEGIDGWRTDTAKDEIYRVRKAFTNNKSLYKE